MQNPLSQVEDKTQQEPLISVIVPIYKVEAYLDRCVQSIVNQTYQNLEIILVDDGSPDKCPEICDEWAIRDARIRTVHKKNGGLSDARNTGIDLAKGEWIAFVDSDDYIMPDMYKRLLSEVIENQADIATCSFFYDYQSYQESLVPFLKQDHAILSAKDMMLICFKPHPVEFTVAWNKLYHKKLFDDKNQIRYPKEQLHEDEFTTYKLLCAANRVVWLHDDFYAYVQRQGSITSHYGLKNLETIFEFTQGYLPWAKEHAPQYRKLIEYAVFNNYVVMLRFCSLNSLIPVAGELINKWNYYLNKTVHKYLTNPYASPKDKLRYILAILHLYLPVWRAGQVVRRYLKS